ncbi:hypothetical protein LCGC14_0044500 [marine sediment metagenome]|uniref:Uncharacterized protein n=2 Tax=root TaxID=1 RepID=A0A7V1BHU3_9RHOB|nr:hypothetical protein [Sulfitobacter litoralis]HDZ53496.1 hypothetical protein [Sulfitobacter litoralis]
MKRIRTATRASIEKKKEELQSLKDRLTNADTPLYQRVGNLALDTAKNTAKAKWSRMYSIWGIGGIAVVQGLQYATSVLPIMPHHLDDPGQVLGEYQAAQAEYLTGAAAGSQMPPEGSALVDDLFTMRNQSSMERYAAFYDRGLEDAQNGDITPPEIEAAARVLRDFETKFSQQYQKSFDAFLDLDLSPRKARQGANAALVYSLFCKEASMKVRKDGTQYLILEFAGQEAWSLFVDEKIQNKATDTFIASMEDSWIEARVLEELTGVTPEDITASFEGDHLVRIAAGKADWRISTTDIRLGIPTSPDSDLTTEDETPTP